MPVIAAVDLAVRWRQVTQWNLREDLFYLVSMLLVLATVRVVAGLLPARERHPRLYLLAVSLLGLLSGFILLVHFDYYFYFGVHPEIIGLGHVVGETAEATRVVWDELTWQRILLGIVLVGLGMASWRLATSVRPRRAAFWGSLAFVVVFAPAFHLNVAMSQGNFLPSVNLIFTASKAVEFALNGKGEFRRMQVSKRIPVPAQPGPEPWNVLFLINESLRAPNTGYNGYKRETTPNVSAFLAAHREQAFNFTRCYTNSTKTAESVPSILTGVHPMEEYRKLHEFPLAYEYVKAFPGTLSFLYAAHGYEVANFRFFLKTPQLDKMLYQENSGHPRYNSMGMDDRFLVAPFEQTLAALPPQTAFVGILHMNGPHFPYRVPPDAEQWGTATREDAYDDSIRYQDRTIGAFLAALQRSGRLEHTIIFSTSDHGEAFGEHGVSGHRRMFYEEIIHIPCWMYLPKALAQRHAAVLRENVSRNVTNLDWVPTLVDLLGLSQAKGVAELVEQMHGHSMVRPQAPDRMILVQNGSTGTRLSDGFAVIQGPWRLLDHPLGETSHMELYNLAQDAGERRDLWPDAPLAERARWQAVIAANPVLARQTAMMRRKGAAQAVAPPQ